MTTEEARDVIRGVLREIAPEADLDTIDPAVELQEELDLDSMNFLDLMAGIHARTGVDIPERDYPSVATLDGCIAYLREHASA